MDPNSILRWVAVLPAALGGAWLTYIVWMIIDRLVLVSQGFDPDSIIGRLWTTVGSSGVMAIAFIWIGVTAAPAHKKNIVGVMGVLAIVISGVLLLPVILVKDILAILGCVASFNFDSFHKIGCPCIPTNTSKSDSYLSSFFS